MPFSITCPSCWTKLKTTAAIPSGRSVQCPKCKKTFVATADNMIDVGARKFGVSDAAPARKTIAADNMNSPARQNRGDGEWWRDHLPASRNGDEKKPRTSKPLSLDDDDDDDFRRRTRGNNRSLTVMVAAGVIGLVGLSGAGYLVYSLLGGRGGADSQKTASSLSGGAEAERLMSMAFLPAETNVMGGIDAEALMNNDKFKGFVKKYAQMAGNSDVMNKLKEAGVTEDDVSHILFGGMTELEPRLNVEKKERMAFAFVIRFKKSIDKAKMTKAMDTTEQKKNDQLFYKSVKPDSHLYVFFPLDSVMVLASSEKQIDSITANNGKLAITDEMKDLEKKLNKGQIWFAFSRALVEDQLKTFDELKGNIPGVPAEAASDLIEAIKSMRGGGGYVKLEGEVATFGLGMLCSESTLAFRATEALNKFLKADSNNNSPIKAISSMVPPEMKNIVNDVQKSISVSSADALVELSAAVNVDSLVPLVKMIESPAAPQGVSVPPAQSTKQPKSNRPQKSK
jgi:hypothetical protein